VLAKVEEDIDEPAPSLGGRAERVSVIATVPDVPPPTDGTIDRLGATGGQALQASDEGDRVVALDDEVNVIGLHREVDDAERVLV
jgi:hypothetical protein